jgi:hypothetical protein
LTHKPNDPVPFDQRAEYAPDLPTVRNAEEGARRFFERISVIP